MKKRKPHTKRLTHTGRVMANFRFRQETNERISDWAGAYGLSRTRFLEELLDLLPQTSPDGRKRPKMTDLVLSLPQGTP